MVTKEKELKELKSFLDSKLKGDVELVGGNLIVYAKSKTLIRDMFFLCNDAKCLFKQLVDVCGVDYPEREMRFEIVYQLLSLKYNNRIMIKVVAKDGEEVPSATEVYNSANWLEREVWDMYGVKFTDHPDLRRILTDYGFDGHPQRKDFPLTGYVEVRYDEEKGRVIYEPVSLDQSFRSFDFESPWEGTDYVLPGDEKAEEEKESA